MNAHAPMTLSTGAVITHTVTAPNAQTAVVSNRAGGMMTDAEWHEYADRLRAEVSPLWGWTETHDRGPTT